MINENILTELKQLKQSIEEVSVYDLNVYSSMELYSRVAGKINELIKEVMTYQGLLSEELLKELDYINNHMDTFLYEIRTNSEMAINDMNIAKDEMIQQVTNQINENQLLINSLLNYSNRLSYLERMLDLLYSENVSHRTNMILEGNHLSLINSKEGLIQVNSTQGNTLWIDNETEKVLTEFDNTKNLRLQSSFEDKVVTQEMVDNGKELAENLGKYKVEYKVTGKNKFNKNTTTITGLINSDGSMSSANDWRIHDYENIKPNISYTVSEDSDNYKQIYVAIYDKGKKFISKYVLEGGSNLTFATPSNSYYYRLGYSVKVLSNTVNRERIQLEEGSTATAYEPYKESIKTYYLNSPLLEGDTIEESNGNVYHVHRYGKAVLDGSDDENWKSAVNSVGTNVYGFGITNGVQTTNTNQLMCDKINTVLYEQRNTDVIGIYGITSRLWILNKTHSTLAEYKTYLSSNPITVVYKLASPTYELISENNELKMKCFNDCSIDYETVIPVEQTDVTFTGEGTSTTSLLVDDVNLETDEITRENDVEV